MCLQFLSAGDIKHVDSRCPPPTLHHTSQHADDWVPHCPNMYCILAKDALFILHQHWSTNSWPYLRWLNVVQQCVRALTPPQHNFNEPKAPQNGNTGLTDTWKRWVHCTVGMKAASDSTDQSSNAPLITQEVWWPAVTLSPSLISYQTQSSNKCAVFPPTELEGRRWLMRMWSLLNWCGEFLWSEQCWRFVIDSRGQWVSGWVSGEEAGLWGSHISCSGSKGNFRAWCDKDRWCWKLVCVCCMMCWTWKTPAAHTHTEALFVMSLQGEVVYPHLKENNSLCNSGEISERHHKNRSKCVSNMQNSAWEFFPCIRN